MEDGNAFVVPAANGWLLDLAGDRTPQDHDAADLRADPNRAEVLLHPFRATAYLVDRAGDPWIRPVEVPGCRGPFRLECQDTPVTDEKWSTSPQSSGKPCSAVHPDRRSRRSSEAVHVSASTPICFAVVPVDEMTVTHNADAVPATSKPAPKPRIVRPPGTQRTMATAVAIAPATTPLNGFQCVVRNAQCASAMVVRAQRAVRRQRWCRQRRTRG